MKREITDGTVTPLIPAHSASLGAFTPVFDGLWTRVNALMAGIQGPQPVTLGPRFRGDEGHRAGSIFPFRVIAV